MKSGRNVPPICMKSNPMAILDVDLNRKVIPMITSHHPITETHCAEFKNGIQLIVASTNGMAAESPKGFKMPNQMKMTANDIRMAAIDDLFIIPAII